MDKDVWWRGTCSHPLPSAVGLREKCRKKSRCSQGGVILRQKNDSSPSHSILHLFPFLQTGSSRHCLRCTGVCPGKCGVCTKELVHARSRDTICVCPRTRQKHLELLISTRPYYSHSHSQADGPPTLAALTRAGQAQSEPLYCKQGPKEANKIPCYCMTWLTWGNQSPYYCRTGPKEANQIPCYCRTGPKRPIRFHITLGQG